MKTYLETTGKFRFVGNANVEGFATERKKITGVRTADGILKADNYIICTGPDKSLLQEINPDIANSILPFSGVSKTVSIKNGAFNPTSPAQMIFPDANGNNQMVNVSVFHKGNEMLVRFAGLYAAGRVSRENLAPFERILDQAINLFIPKGIAKNNTSDMWVGYRPMTPNTLPIIGRDGNFNNLIYNIGQGSSGTSLAAGSAYLAVSSLLRKTLSAEGGTILKTLSPGGKSIL